MKGGFKVSLCATWFQVLLVSRNDAVQEETEKSFRSDVNIISNTGEELRGSPSPAVRAGGNLVGRGIANPMSERTRGFEIPKGASLSEA